MIACRQVAATVTVTAVLVKAQTPRPATITQGDPQRVIWETTAYLQTPYPVEKQTLKVQRQPHVNCLETCSAGIPAQSVTAVGSASCAQQAALLSSRMAPCMTAIASKQACANQ